jgi:hypothetical protein
MSTSTGLTFHMIVSCQNDGPRNMVERNGLSDHARAIEGYSRIDASYVGFEKLHEFGATARSFTHTSSKRPQITVR